MSSAPVKKSKKSRSTKQVEETPVVETPVVETPVVETPVIGGESSQETETETLTSFQILEAIQDQRRIIREAEAQMSKLLKKLASAMRRETRKVRRSKPESSGKREQKKRPIVDTLAELMGVDKGAEYSRGDVQSFICRYVKEHGLQCSDDKKCFQTDEALGKVLGAPRHPAHDKNQEIRHSYNNLMKILSDLFVKTE